MVKENKVSLMKWLHLCNTDSTKIQTLGASRGFFCALTAACSCASCSSHAARIMTGPIRITSPVIISRRAPDSKKNKNNFWWNGNCFLTLVKQKQTLWTIKL